MDYDTMLLNKGEKPFKLTNVVVASFHGWTP